MPAILNASANAFIGLVIGGLIGAAALIKAARIALYILFAVLALLPVALIRRRLLGDAAVRLSRRRAPKAFSV